MMKQQNGRWYLELEEIIRVNRLIRPSVDLDGFSNWYRSLAPQQQRALICALCDYACQAGVEEDIYSAALAAADLTENDVLLRRARPFFIGCIDMQNLDLMLSDIGETAQLRLFRFFVFLFGGAEGRVFQAETKRHCNHWWHRDLLDDRVVRALLSDPQFYNTSMRDDDEIKRPPRRVRSISSLFKK